MKLNHLNKNNCVNMVVYLFIFIEIKLKCIFGILFRFMLTV